MSETKLIKVVKKGARRVGRGPGSGRGKTSGKGTKGQNARGKLALTHSHYEGGQRPLIKRLPYRRGKGNPKVSNKPIIINMDALALIPKGQVINIENLAKSGIVNKQDATKYGVKILRGSKIQPALTIDVPISKKAAEKVIKAGGKVTHK